MGLMKLFFLPVRPLVYLMVCIALVLSCHGGAGIYYSGQDGPAALGQDTPAPLFPVKAANAADMAPAPSAVRVWVPAVPASTPLILALSTQAWAEFTIFSNHARAHALFLRGEIDLLATGLSIGKGFFDRGAPVRMINGYVTGMTWLVTDRPIREMSDLAGLPLVLPFQGSPIEQATRVFIRKANLTWNREIPIRYLPFQSTVALMGKGELHAAALPEPYATMVTTRPGNWAAVSYKDLWEQSTGGSHGYPQVGVFALALWAEQHPDLIRRLNHAVAKAVIAVKADPQTAAQQMATVMNFSPELILTALVRTEFRLMTGKSLASEVYAYYNTLGSPLGEQFEAFF